MWSYGYKYISACNLQNLSGLKQCSPTGDCISQLAWVFPITYQSTVWTGQPSDVRNTDNVAFQVSS
jgi:hypothetical protein